MQNVKIKTEDITLGQFLKLAGVIHTGGHAKFFLQEHEVFVNGTPENRRGKKLKISDIVEVKNIGTFVVASKL